MVLCTVLGVGRFERKKKMKIRKVDGKGSGLRLWKTSEAKKIKQLQVGYNRYQR